MRFSRILLKVSGELLAGEKKFGIEPGAIQKVAEEIKGVHDLGVQIGIIIGGGNVFRGLSLASQGMQRVTGDLMGMLSTVINSIALQDYLEQLGVATRVCSAINMDEIAEPFIRRRALRHLEKNRVVIFAAGTGSPNFTTDTAASLRAIEMEADVIIKGTRVDGVFDSDPHINKHAQKFDEVTYLDVVQKGLKVMDPTAITLSMDNNLPIIVFNLSKKGNLLKLIKGEKLGTIVRDNSHD
ncbi:UMP kinase [candidate division KSB1 bacterium]